MTHRTTLVNQSELPVRHGGDAGRGVAHKPPVVLTDYRAQAHAERLGLPESTLHIELKPQPYNGAGS